MNELVTAVALSKICGRCREQKSADSFCKDKRTPTGLFSWCNDCRSSYQKLRYAARTPEDKKELHLKALYGLTAEKYEAILEKQNGVCRICETSGPNHQQLFVDHDHTCCPGVRTCGNCIRGLLCRHCNSAIGFLNDDPVLFDKAKSYILGFRGSMEEEEGGAS